MDRRLILVGVALLVIGVAATTMRKDADKPKLSFSEEELLTLEDKLQGLETEDLRGLSGGVSSPGFSEEELEQIGSKIDGLSFEDLEGLTSP